MIAPGVYEVVVLSIPPGPPGTSQWMSFSEDYIGSIETDETKIGTIKTE
jgi:hypothetical protein